MSWLFWLVMLLGGVVSTAAAVAITAVILLVLGQAAILLYRKSRNPAPANA